MSSKRSVKLKGSRKHKPPQPTLMNRLEERLNGLDTKLDQQGDQLANVETNVTNLASAVEAITTQSIIQNPDLRVRYGQDALTFLDILNLLAANRLPIDGGEDIRQKFIQQMQIAVFRSFQKNSASSAHQLRFPPSAIPSLISEAQQIYSRDVTFENYGFSSRLLGSEDFPPIPDPDSSWFVEDDATVPEEGEELTESPSTSTQHNHSSPETSTSAEHTEVTFSRTHVSTSPELADPPAMMIPRCTRRISDFFEQVDQLPSLAESPDAVLNDADALEDQPTPLGLIPNSTLVIRKRSLIPQGGEPNSEVSAEASSVPIISAAPAASTESIRESEESANKESEDYSFSLPSTPVLATRSARAAIHPVFRPLVESINLEGPRASTPTSKKPEAGWQLVETRNQRLSRKQAEREAAGGANRLSSNFGSESNSPIQAGGGGGSASVSSRDSVTSARNSITSARNSVTSARDSQPNTTSTTSELNQTVIARLPNPALSIPSSLAGTSRWSDPNFRKMKEEQFLALESSSARNGDPDDDDEPYGLPDGAEEWLTRQEEAEKAEAEAKKSSKTKSKAASSSASSSKSKSKNRQGSIEEHFVAAAAAELDDVVAKSKSSKKKGGKGKMSSKSEVVVEVEHQQKDDAVAEESAKEDIDAAPGPSKGKKRATKSKKAPEVSESEHEVDQQPSSRTTASTTSKKTRGKKSTGARARVSSIGTNS